jgi:lactate permease
MAVVFALAIVATGFAVAHIEGGYASVRRGVVPVLAAGGVMALSVWVLTVLDAPQIASVVPGLAGCLVLWAIAGRTNASRTRRLETEDSASTTPSRSMSFHTAFLPYYLLIGLTVLSQAPWVKDLGKTLVWGLNYPGLTTALGYAVKAESLYARIGLVSHPAPLLVGAALASFAIYRGSGIWRPRVAREAAKVTFRQCVPTTVGIATMVMMALAMNDTGMTTLLAEGIALATGALFPLISPFIGVLGCFMTGSNTNSNIMFGSLQLETAKGLGLSTVIIAAAQSVGGSLGSAIAPAKVLIGSAVVGLDGREGQVMSRAIPYCLLIVLLVGIEVWLFVYVLFRDLP